MRFFEAREALDLVVFRVNERAKEDSRNLLTGQYLRGHFVDSKCRKLLALKVPVARPFSAGRAIPERFTRF